MNISTQTLAKLAAAYAGAVFGIYWIPVRALEAGGFPGIWATWMFNLVPFVLIVPILAWRWQDFAQPRLRFHIGGVLTGLTLSAYSLSFLYTDVVRAVLLFYLTPIWGFLLGWAVLGERITRIRWVAIGLGAIGMVVIFGDSAGLPLPRNAGDWLALASGVFWAIASVMMLTDRQGSAIGYGLCFFVYGCLAVSLLVLAGSTVGTIQQPDWQALPEVLPWLGLVALLVVVPGGFATIYGPTVLNPGVVGLLFMTEITIATVTAAIWAGEPFGTREILGVLLISLAGLVEPLAAFVARTAGSGEKSER